MCFIFVSSVKKTWTTGKASSRQAIRLSCHYYNLSCGEHSYPYFAIFITMRGSHIMRVSVILTRSFLHAGKCPMRGSVTSYYHAGKCRAGKVHAGNLHAGKYHRTVMSCMQRFQDILAYFATAVSYWRREMFYETGTCLTSPESRSRRRWNVSSKGAALNDLKYVDKRR